MNRKALIFISIGVLFLSALASTASAAPVNRRDSAVGAGVFIHDHEGMPHTHYFAFSVQEGPRNTAQGTFSLVCRHETTIEVIIHSTKITSVTVTPVQGGLEATFSGSAVVRMDNAWTNGWTFTVTAYDFDWAGADMVGVTLTDPQGQVHCSAEPTTLSYGNIIIKN